MRQFFIASLLTAAVALSCASSSYRTQYVGDRVFRIHPRNENELDILKTLEPYALHRGTLDFWQRPTVVGMPVDVHVSHASLEKFESFLENYKLDATVLHADLQADINKIDMLNRHLKNLKANNSIVGTFASHADINTWLSQQCDAFPNITSCGSWGLSYEGRDMRYIHISQKPAFPVSPKQAIYIVSGMHAREWLGPATIIWIVNQILTNYGKDQTVTNLVNQFDWYIEPVINPDGYEYSRNSERLWRKTRTPTVDANCPGIDGNRNFDYMWAGGGNPCDDDYPGGDALADKVNQNIDKFMKKQNQTQKGLAFFSVHTYSKVWLLPYGYAQKAYPPDYEELLRVGTIGVNALMAVHNQRWQVGNIVDLLYVAAGNSADYYKGHNYATYSYALELRGNSFVVPASDIVPSGEEVFAGFVAAVKAMKV